MVAADPQLKPADINSLSTTYLGTTEPLFDRYLKVGLIGAVKRRFEPGCKFDTVVTLDGDGGIYKSEFWIVLASPDWHSSRMLNRSRRWPGCRAEASYALSTTNAATNIDVCGHTAATLRGLLECHRNNLPVTWRPAQFWLQARYGIPAGYPEPGMSLLERRPGKYTILPASPRGQTSIWTWTNTS